MMPTKKAPLKKSKMNPKAHPQLKSPRSSQKKDSADVLKQFVNREVGWLNFNLRVLTEAEDERNPLLERIRFLSISASNLDEFFMKRVGGLKRQVAYGVSGKSSDGQTAQQQLDVIRKLVPPMVERQAVCFKKLKLELQKQDIFLVKWKSLNSFEKQQVKKYFHHNVFPVLTPLSVDPGHPFPFISNLSTSLGVTLKHPENKDEKLFARVKIPKVLPQWILIESDRAGRRFISLLDLIQENLSELFPAMLVLDVMPFRLTRNADSDRDEEDAEDLLEMIEEELRQRRFAEVVRLECGQQSDPWMLDFLKDELDLTTEDIYSHSQFLDYTDLNSIAELPLQHLRYPSYPQATPLEFLEEGQLFEHLKTSDILVHHPYESFANTVEKFVQLACDDPKVLAIKMTLYRTGDNSPFIKALIRAAESGKQVVCLIELKARFDEERNIYWAQALENAGVHVVYGVVGLKTHAKVTLIVRQESEGLRSYAHVGTGNYNSATSKFYTDMGLLTAHEGITQDLIEFFHYLTGRSLKTSYQHMLIAPVNMFSSFKNLIQREIDHAEAGRPSLLIAKFNNMEENEISAALYKASQAGVDIHLIVRGFCCLRAGLKGLSERIQVISIIGRFLEHSRIFYFRNGAEDPLDGDFFIGSADWMYRNLHARIEAIVPILDRRLKEKCWLTLQMCLKDQRQVWEMKSDGSYIKRVSNKNAPEEGVHGRLTQWTQAQIFKKQEME